MKKPRILRAALPGPDARLFTMTARHVRPAARIATALCLLSLAGCATVEHKAPGPRAEPAPGSRVIQVQGQRQRLVTIALQEWTLWGSPRIDLSGRLVPASRSEFDPDFTSRVLMYWFVIRGSEFPTDKMRLGDGSLLPWSAVFVSYLMHAAGVPREVFMPSPRHWDYIKRIHDFPNPAGFEALDARLAAPRVGDIICATRSWTSGQVTSFAQLASNDSRGTYHCDLVVRVSPGLLGAIGGNVRDAVTWTDVRLDANGLLQPTPGRPWLVVLRNNLP
jgi:hypothetical protein